MTYFASSILLCGMTKLLFHFAK